MSDTPRTDAKEFRAETVSGAAIVVWSDDMRDLERELAALRAENEALNTEKRVLEMNYKVWTQRALAAEAGLARLKAAQ